jgi:GNAT superfamily N-acetyltransferase
VDEIAIRQKLRPGDLGELVRLHGELYAAEYGLNGTFEADVARSLADCLERGWPDDGGGVWLAEAGGRLVGAIALTREGEADARLRWFLLAAGARGRGLGRRLLAGLLEHADGAGFARIELVTFSELTAAAHLYRGAGFRRVAAGLDDRWGRPLTIERYERRRRGT